VHIRDTLFVFPHQNLLTWKSPQRQDTAWPESVTSSKWSIWERGSRFATQWQPPSPHCVWQWGSGDSLAKVDTWKNVQNVTMPGLTVFWGLKIETNDWVKCNILKYSLFVLKLIFRMKHNRGLRHEVFKTGIYVPLSSPDLYWSYSEILVDYVLFQMTRENLRKCGFHESWIFVL
jgi:hypothetical protein